VRGKGLPGRRRCRLLLLAYASAFQKPAGET
jgi:hypothetical protein